MTRSPFDPRFADLPGAIPIFPLTGVLLLPGGRLPLRIFEPRYLAMTDDALRGERIIGMIQPSEPPPRQADEWRQEAESPLFPTGCAGRIVAFEETDNGHVLATLAGLCRFTVRDELSLVRGYRRVVPDWSRFAADMEDEEECSLDRERLVTLLQGYFRKQGLSANWEAIESAPDERLITSLAMICPFEPNEKQALLEADTVADRAEVIMALLEMALVEQPQSDRARH